MRVGELMTRDVLTVGPEETLRDVASLLATEHIGGVPVVAGEEVVGVISAADVLDFDADTPGAPTERVQQTAGFGESPEDLAADVEAGDEATAAYFTDFWEEVGADVVEPFERGESPEWSALDEHVASEVMTRVVFSVAPDVEVREAARRMLDADVHRALVIDAEGRLVGVFTSLDVLRAVAERGLAS